MLINQIGLDNISTFSGSYNDLLDKPDIPQYISDLINDLGFDTEDNIDQKLHALKENLVQLINESKNSADLSYTNKVELENAINEAKTYADSLYAGIFKSLSTQISNAASKTQLANKADLGHSHRICDVDNLMYELESRSKINHNHDDVYADKTIVDYLTNNLQNQLDESLEKLDEHVDQVSLDFSELSSS